MKLRVTWQGGSAIFEPSDAVTVGRIPEATITIDETIVSRAHVSFTFLNNMWTFEDLSSNGTFIEGDRVSIGGVGGPITLHLGTPTGPKLALEPVPDSAVTPPVPPVASPTIAQPVPPPVANPPSAPAAPIPPATPAAAASSPSPIVSSSPPTPPTPPVAAPTVGAAAAAVSAPLGTETIRLDDRHLRLELGGQTRSFAPGARVVVGRDSSCDMQTDSQLVSGQHCVFINDGGQWWVEDLGSTRGTWIDHKKIKREKIEGAFFVLLGDDDAGEPLRVVTAGEHRKPKDNRPLFLAGAALAVVLLGGLAALLLWPSDDAAEIAELRDQLEDQQRMTDEQLASAQEQADQAIAEANARGGAGNSPSELMQARLSTALISVPDADGNIIGTGSGALVSVDGIILTNIHVVRPGLEYERTGDATFVGLEDPESLLVAFPSEDGGPADLYFRAEQLDAHPAHDAALIRIVEALEGATMDDLPEPLRLGDSTDLRAGDQIAVVGYPGTAFTERVSVALSNFQSFQPCIAGTQFDDGWGCLRDYDEGYLNLAGETLEGGSSGGPILRQGEVVGIQLGTFGEPGASSAQNLGVPIDLIEEDLEVG